MKRLVYAAALAFAMPAAAGPLDDGIRALQAGDFTEARATFTPLANQGDGNAQFMLGVMLENGLGTAKDPGAAAAWYRKAAARGYVVAMHNLAIRYTDGRGITRDFREAVRWFRKAAEAGIRRGDLILEVNRHRVKRPGEVARIIENTGKGDPLSFLIKRKNRGIVVIQLQK